MNDEVERLGAVVAGGAGLVLAAGANLLPGRRARAAGTAAVAGLVVAGVWVWSGDLPDAAAAAGVLAAGLVLGSDWAAAAARRPAVRWAVVAAAGAAVAAGSVAAFEADAAARDDWDVADLRAAGDRSETVPAPAEAATDRGTPVPLRESAAPRPAADLAAIDDRIVLARWRGLVIHRGPGDDRSNCHGWVFAGGRYCVPGEAVERILAENGYRPVDDPRPGDLAVYRGDGAVAHTAVVRYAADGQPPLVEGKWGPAGVYLHPAGVSAYGSGHTFYRSRRDGHLLAGLGGRPPTTAGGPDDAD